MKIKNLKINERLVTGVLCGTIMIGTISAIAFYSSYDNKEQICETELSSDNLFIDEDGNFNCYFDVGEHIIQISRNDAYYYKSEEIEGYTIKEVVINGWRSNNKITYVNTEPVIAIATGEKNGNLEFNDFGIVSFEKDMNNNNLIIK